MSLIIVYSTVLWYFKLESTKAKYCWDVRTETDVKSSTVQTRVLHHYNTTTASYHLHIVCKLFLSSTLKSTSGLIHCNVTIQTVRNVNWMPASLQIPPRDPHGTEELRWGLRSRCSSSHHAQKTSRTAQDCKLCCSINYLNLQQFSSWRTDRSWRERYSPLDKNSRTCSVSHFTRVSKQNQQSWAWTAWKRTKHLLSVSVKCY